MELIKVGSPLYIVTYDNVQTGKQVASPSGCHPFAQIEQVTRGRGKPTSYDNNQTAV